MGRETGAGGAPRGGGWSLAPQGPWQGRAHWASRRPAPTPARSGCHLRMLGFHFITGLCTQKKKKMKSFPKGKNPRNSTSFHGSSVLAYTVYLIHSFMKSLKVQMRGKCHCDKDLVATATEMIVTA